MSAASEAVVFVVQGLPDREIDVEIDGKSVATDVEGATLTKGFTLDPGSHTFTFSEDGTDILSTEVEVDANACIDVVLHLPVDPAGEPVVTLFDNNSEPVPADKASVTVAHTAAVVPADIRVDGKVLFANVANGEALNLVVPVGTYTVDIVPTGESEPVVLGPLELTVQGGSLNRVFAVGDPQSESMRVVVQVFETAKEGSSTPENVDTGTGGQMATTVSTLFTSSR